MICAEPSSIPVDGVPLGEYLDSFCRPNVIVKNKSSIHRVLFLPTARIMLSLWSSMPILIVITWCNVTVCLINIHRSNVGMASLLPSLTWQLSIHPVWWRVAGNHGGLVFGATGGWSWVRSMLTQATPMSCSTVSLHPYSVVLWYGVWLVVSQSTCFDNQVSAQSMQQSILCCTNVSFRTF